LFIDLFLLKFNIIYEFVNLTYVLINNQKGITTK